MKTFEDYLRNLHAQEYHGTDDDMPEAYETWLQQFDIAEILELVAKYEADKKIAAAHLGSLGGSVKSEKKAKAVRENGKKGGRPKKRNLVSPGRER